MACAYEDLLPIGSVVRLRKGKKSVMIFGLMQTSSADATAKYDYIAVPYPEGNLGMEYQYLFNHESIEEIVVPVNKSAEHQAFVLALKEHHKP